MDSLTKLLNQNVSPQEILELNKVQQILLTDLSILKTQENVFYIDEKPYILVQDYLNDVIINSQKQLNNQEINIKKEEPKVRNKKKCGSCRKKKAEFMRKLKELRDSQKRENSQKREGK